MSISEKKISQEEVAMIAIATDRFMRLLNKQNDPNFLAVAVPCKGKVYFVDIAKWKDQMGFDPTQGYDLSEQELQDASNLGCGYDIYDNDFVEDLGKIIEELKIEGDQIFIHVTRDGMVFAYN